MSLSVFAGGYEYDVESVVYMHETFRESCLGIVWVYVLFFGENGLLMSVKDRMQEFVIAFKPFEVIELSLMQVERTVPINQ